MLPQAQARRWTHVGTSPEQSPRKSLSRMEKYEPKPKSLKYQQRGSRVLYTGGSSCDIGDQVIDTDWLENMANTLGDAVS